MALESISGIGQVGSTAPDTMPFSMKVATSEPGKTVAPVELPGKAVKSTSEAQEKEQLEDAADKLNGFVGSISQELNFSVDRDTGRLVVKVVDRQSGDLIRQIPSEEALEISKALDTLNGLIIRDEA